MSGFINRYKLRAILFLQIEIEKLHFIPLEVNKINYAMNSWFRGETAYCTPEARKRSQDDAKKYKEKPAIVCAETLVINH